MRPLAVVLLALALPAAAQSPEDARATLAECLEVRAAEDVEARRACYYEAADAYAPYDEHEVEHAAADGDMGPGEAVELALFTCVSDADDVPAEAACFDEAAEAYRGAIAAVERELLPSMSPAEHDAYLGAAAAWGAYHDAEAAFLEAQADPDRYATPGAYEQGHLDARVRLVDVLRVRYEWLDALPRG